MARERRDMPMPETTPKPDPDEVSKRFDLTDLSEGRAAALAPEKVAARKHRPSTDPITRALGKTASGGFGVKILRPARNIPPHGEKVVVSDEAYSEDEDEKGARTETVANTNDDKLSAKTTIHQEKPKAEPPPPPRERRASSKAIPSRKRSGVSGKIHSKDEIVENLTDYAVLEEEPNKPSVEDGDEPHAEMTLTRDETPKEPPTAPRRKRARRAEIYAQALTDKAAEDEKARKQRIAEMGARVDDAIKDEDEKNQQLAEMEARIDKELEEDEAKQLEEQRDAAWFAQGEDPTYVNTLAEKQQAKDAQKAEDVRRHIAETYDARESETILSTSDEVEATAKQAEAMLASGELNSEVFNVKDYRYLLIEKARIERELETAGWWQARKLRSELKETDKNLADYEQQIESVHSERAADREAARKPTEGPWRGTRILPPGSGTTRKRGFIARLFGR